MTLPTQTSDTLLSFDEPTRALVRLAVVVTTGSDSAIRQAFGAAAGSVPTIWVEELLLQTQLFAGFPRALNGMREWRRVSPEVPAAELSGVDRGVLDSGLEEGWRLDGLATCAAVYGSMYERLRENIRALHPALDDWMVIDGYGKVLSRPGLDLGRRELCIIAACAAADQDRQLHSHLHGAVNVGVATSVIADAIDSIADLLTPGRAQTVRMLWARVRGK